ncbi:hypothetical protein EOA30_32965 [Mesorhizobium sp. M8A.F.Ca.ET.059.01.1.1]|nr:hypothetical protein EOA30_32965 [Mesorhizobium sp. M8A.F.Ca.ET.059.01.1.1]
MVGAAPHLPAGILSPYRDGERDASLMISPVSRRKKGEGIAASHLAPFTGRDVRQRVAAPTAKIVAFGPAAQNWR